MHESGVVRTQETCWTCKHLRALEYDYRGHRAELSGWCCTLLEDTVTEVLQPGLDRCELYEPKEPKEET